MTAIMVVLLISAVLAGVVYYLAIEPDIKLGNRGQKNVIYIILLILAAFIIRLVCAAKYQGHETDMSCFNAWSSMIFKNGFGSFYESESFTDYPPGYMYVLYLLGAIKELFGLSTESSYVLLKMPAIICDLILGAFIWKEAGKKFGERLSVIFAAFYMLNPAVILNSALWGQVDAVYTLFVVLMIYLIANRRMISSYFVFAICIFIKPQAFIFTPVLICGIIENVFLPKFDKDKFVKNLLWGLGAIAMLVLISLPFGIDNVIDQYKATLESYPYMTVNAFNLWGALKMNWTALTPIFSVIGYIFLAAIVAYSFYVFFKSKNPSKYYFVGGLLAFLTFMLSTKMHDRYAFAMMALFLLAYVTTPKSHVMYLYILSMLSQFFNTAWVLFVYSQDINKYFVSPVVRVASWINIAVLVYAVFITHKEYIKYKEPVKAAPVKSKYKQKQTAQAPKTVIDTPKSRGAKKKIERSAIFAKVTAFDIAAMIVITAVYSAVALYDLGDMHAAETTYSLAGKTVSMDLGADYNISKIKFFNGSYELGDDRSLTIKLKGKDGEVTRTLTSGAVFYWSEADFSDKSYRYITLSTNGDNLDLKEFGIIASDGSKIVPVNVSEFAELFDEQDEIPDRTSFRNSTYFDEIYHARTAYEFIHSMTVYEWTHPPLGKCIMALGILIFGMCPFGWRIAGTFVGILMVPLMYMFAKRFTNKSWLAVVTCLLFTFDFMHFAQSRLATIDVYVTFFIMLTYYFMYRYCRISFYDTDFKKTLIPLGLSGIFMGCAIASKWTGLYAAVGLAIIFFVTLYKRYSEYLYAQRMPGGETDGIKHKDIINKFPKYALRTILFCCVFFIVVPAVIYCCSYIPYLKAPNMHGIKSIIENARSMYTYHSKTVVQSTHPYSSKWYEWIIMKRPIWYYSGTISSTVKEGISGFGNPAVWWVGIAALLYCIYASIRKRDKRSIFLVIAYAVLIVPWIPIERTTFIYHYFPMVPFLTLMICCSIDHIYERFSAGEECGIAAGFNAAYIKAMLKMKGSRVIIASFAYVAVAIILFVMFYPVISGHPCGVEYAKNWLKWFDSWVLL